MIRFDAVNKRFPNGTTAVHDLTLEMPEGGITVLVGSSGCGKTTTLRMINRMVEPTSGTIRLGGKDVLEQDAAELRRGIGYVIQQSGLFPHRTVLDNIATVPLLLGWGRRKARTRAAELLETVGLTAEAGKRYPHQLSGGQQQRVGVARALAADPPVLLMDEPFGAVDPVVRTQLQDELLRLQKDLNKTIVFVTHDIDEAVRLGDRIAVFRTGGHLVQCAAPAELLARPADGFVADFLGAERELKLLSLTTLAEVPVRRVTTVREGEPVPRTGEGPCLVVSARNEPLGWLDPEQRSASPAGTGTSGPSSPGTPGTPGPGSPGRLTPVRPLRDTDSLLAALNESIASPTGLTVRVDAEGVLKGVTSRETIHEHAGRRHQEAARAALDAGPRAGTTTTSTDASTSIPEPAPEAEPEPEATTGPKSAPESDSTSESESTSESAPAPASAPAGGGPASPGGSV
ncbi:ABC transporter ATP-binding protein [Streptomyces sp. NPDC002018]|uniref:ABC transporter ATP-binding protein n=1 Tax=Streptomyces sp. NPDC002018 TaxID=3364629 RepID=UPI0036C0B01D